MNKFLAMRMSFIFACTVAMTAMAGDSRTFQLINKSGYSIKYRQADQSAPAGAQEFLLENGASATLEKRKLYSIRRSGFGSTITAGWWNIVIDDLFKSSGSDYAFFARIQEWNGSPNASITIYPGKMYGWVFEAKS